MPRIQLKFNMKNCSKCKTLKPIVDFSKNGGDKVRSQCKSCYNSNWKNRVMSSISSRTSIRTRPNGDVMKMQTSDKSINSKFLEELKEKQDGLCYWLKIPLDFTLKDRLRKPSLDRLDNNLGYTSDNVVLTTVFANTGRRDASTIEMKSFLKKYFNK